MQSTAVDESGKHRKLISIRGHHKERCGQIIFVGLAGGYGRGQRNQPTAAAHHPKQTVQGRTPDGVDHHAEELVEQQDHLCGRSCRRELGRADQIDKQHRDIALLAAQFGAAL